VNSPAVPRANLIEARRDGLVPAGLGEVGEQVAAAKAAR